MSVTERPLDPQVAVELAHELVLVTRATFAQLLPSTAARAISGVPGLGDGAPVSSSTTATPESQDAPAAAVLTQAAPVAAPTASALPPPVSIPVVTVPAATISVATVAPTVDVPVLTAGPDDVVGHTPPTPVENPADYIPVPGVQLPAAVPAVSLPSAAPVAVPVVAPAPTPFSPTTEPAANPEAEADEHVGPAAPIRSIHPNLAMLEEIGFLDE